jgi:hypothetical protein
MRVPSSHELPRFPLELGLTVGFSRLWGGVYAVVGEIAIADEPGELGRTKRKLKRSQPAHVSTTLIFALLARHCGLRAEMLGGPDLRDDGSAVEQ